MIGGNLKIFKIIIFFIFSSVHIACASISVNEQNIVLAIQKKDSKQLESLFSEKLSKSFKGIKVINSILDLEKYFGNLNSIDFFKRTGNKVFYILYFSKAKASLKLVLNQKKLLDSVWIGPSIANEVELLETTSFDGLKLSTKVSAPKSSSEGVIIMVHGSGPNDYNGNGAGEKKIPSSGLFNRLSQAFQEQNFTIIRYNKRSTEVKFLSSLEEDTEAFNNKKFYYNAFLKDLEVVIRKTKELFPGQKIYLLGHSQGTGLALQATLNEKNKISGVLLIGFTTIPIMFSSYSQYIYRPHTYFNRLDKNSDGYLSKKESDKNLLQQFPIIDLNKDNKISLNEFDAANMIKFNRSGMSETIKSLTVEQLQMPSPIDILKKSNFKVLFAQGEWDHQTPSSFPKSILHMNNLFWKKKNLNFMFLPKLGHELNLQEEPIEFNYKPISPEIAQKVALRFRKLVNFQ